MRQDGDFGQMLSLPGMPRAILGRQTSSGNNEVGKKTTKAKSRVQFLPSQPHAVHTGPGSPSQGRAEASGVRVTSRNVSCRKRW